jgi:hypothetical protein
MTSSQRKEQIKVGDLVSLKNDDIEISGMPPHSYGVVVSHPVSTKNGFSVKVAVHDKIMSVYTWLVAKI